MNSIDIRRTFLDFFEKREHRIVPSASLVPEDPTLLLTVAGMVPFKPFFLGRRTPEYARAASVQKCVRTLDIDIVGTNARNLSFFEMLGNFSFGDYFKSDACRWGWELATGAFGLDPERLWVTVFETDQEAYEIWRDEVGVAEDRIVRRGAEDNFWWMGVAGPCGPCSEIFYDRGPAYGDAEGFQDGDRIMEFWNLVFMESICDDTGAITGVLEKKNIDTGSGLERVAMMLQDVPSAYETDLMRPILARAEELTGHAYGADPRTDVSLRVMTDHARAASFLIGDGILPSNEDRGYVLRRLVRRLVRHARTLGTDAPVMPGMVEAVVAALGEAWPDLSENAAFISQVAGQEEDHFSHTLRQGLTMLETEIGAARSRGSQALSGDVGFKLHDTYGFPVDLTMEIAAEAGLELDRVAYERLMDEQRERARLGRKDVTEGLSAQALEAVLAESGGSVFVGHEADEAEATVAGLLRGGQRVPAAGEGEDVEIVLPRTPFYPEGGGQIGDAGTIRTAGGLVEVHDTQRLHDELIVHRGRVVRGEVRAGEAAHAAVDRDRRAATMRSHTATHLLHWALREAVGPHARQAGSLVAPGRLRFDFPHFEAVPSEILSAVEETVNARLAADDAVQPYETTMDEARRRGAMMLFEEKYGSIVRVVEIGDYSVELCGGTHVTHTSQVGVVKLLSEGSIGAGQRRVEALTGPEALEGFRREALILEQVTALLKTSPEDAPDRIRRLMEDLKAAEAEIRKARQAGQKGRAKDLAASAEQVGSVRFVAAELEGLSMKELQPLALEVRAAAGGPAAVVLGSAHDGKAAIVAALTKGLAVGEVSARRLIADAAKAIGGGAGGKEEVATGGGGNPGGIAEALRLARAAAERMFA